MPCHSFEVAVPATPLSLVERYNQSNRTSASKNMDVRTVIPRDAFLGKKLDLNRPLGNGIDDGGDGIVDNDVAATAQQSSQNGAPELDLDNAGDGAMGDLNAKQLMAKDLYVTAMLACSDVTNGAMRHPTTFMATSSGTPDEDYARMVAQWAVNIVDFRDPDSIMTRFAYDPDPFNGVWDTSGGDFVFGAERPELLINETFAYHDRATTDQRVDSGGTMNDSMMDGDPHWDNLQVPRSGAFFELYHPWVQDSSAGDATTHESIPREFGATGVNLGQTTTSGDPVWRMGLRRDKADAMFNRAIYFATNPNTARPSLRNGLSTGSEFFFTTLASKTVAPGDYAVIGSAGNVGLVGGVYRTTFGRRQTSLAPMVTPAEINMTRGIGLDHAGDRVIRNDGRGGVTAVNAEVVVIDSASATARTLSVSDPNGGYNTGAAVAAPAGDGVFLMPAEDVPFDLMPDGGMNPYRNGDDVADIYRNETVDNFRFVFLQRLANPLLDFDADTNPYITIDSAGVDLLCFNGMTDNQNNGATAEPSVPTPPAVPGTQPTEFRSAERGESFSSVAVARQSFFTSDDGNGMFMASNANIFDGAAIPPGPAGPPNPTDSHNFSFQFEETFGAQNASHTDTTTFTPISWLTWNDRPFANAAEVANVPFVSPEGLTFFFNQGSQSSETPSAQLVAERDVVNHFGRVDDDFMHLMRLGQDNGDPSAGGRNETNRMVNFLEFVEVPNRFLGSETYLPVVANRVADGNGGFATGLFPRFQPPFHSIPSFRTPGKVNFNTIYSETVWDSLLGGTSNPGFMAFRMNRDMGVMASDFAGFYAPPGAGEFVVAGQGGMTNNKGADKTIFRRTSPSADVGTFDAASTSPRDSVGSAYFRNELRQKLGAVATTRSSVFAIWIAVGYFEVDEFGRLGAEVGSELGEVNRNRAFYMIDRSIPVAFEPGVDHNVDETILLRTIIE